MFLTIILRLDIDILIIEPLMHVAGAAHRGISHISLSWERTVEGRRNVSIIVLSQLGA